MKKISLFLIVILTSLNCFAQIIHLQIKGKTINETKTIDSIAYQSKHKNTESLLEEIKNSQNSLLKKGYLTIFIETNLKINDSSYIAFLSLGKKTSFVQIIRSSDVEINKILEINKDTTTIPFSNLDLFLNEKKRKLNTAGYPLATIRLSNINTRPEYLIAKLEVDKNLQKKINTIIVAKNDNDNFRFPKSHLNQIKKKYHNTLLNQYNLDKIKDEFDQYDFAKQSSYPETLFTKDSTKVYIYIEKQKSNNFDGFIGFNTNENQKLTFSGYLDLQLENILNSGEEFRLNWKSNGNNQTTFNSALELPYLFGGPVGMKGYINIFKQDSTFQNTKSALEASYFIKYSTRIYIGRETTSSSDIQNSNNGNISDYKSEFYTSTFLYNRKDQKNFMNPVKTNMSLKIGTGKRENTNSQTVDNINKQTYIELKSTHTFYLNTKNHFNTKAIFHSLNSKDYGLNELYRFGGFNSIRGFQENSLQAKTYFVLATEYRYLLSPTFYVNTVVDYSYSKPPTNTIIPTYVKNRASLGAGIAINTKSGILILSIVKPYRNNNKTNFYNTIAHLSYNVKF